MGNIFYKLHNNLNSTILVVDTPRYRSGTVAFTHSV